MSQNVVPACLPWKSVPPLRDSDLLVMGWGKTTNRKFSNTQDLATFGVHERTVQKLTLPLASDRLCERTYGRRLSPHYICAGGEKNRDTCKGDSGGPLIAREGTSGPMFVVGVVSFGTEKCGSGFPAAYTNVQNYLPWILDNMRD